eukprot:CAMPEP_0179858728 /NCGR_PEP_ID=MMETSP0982-20121206/12606_1 /TAXON_ID=483367 /ORGANISM="non described non described, Strain CCMP 2436" /LENGTH=550 /DNA_ID=CAMNT_0021745669 /DNA_START=25 /DNA_END=1677 /DNA_ORIENTATION=+
MATCNPAVMRLTALVLLGASCAHGMQAARYSRVLRAAVRPSGFIAMATCNPAVMRLTALVLLGASCAHGMQAARYSRVLRAAVRPSGFIAMAADLPDAIVVFEEVPDAAEATVALTIPGEATRVVWDKLMVLATKQAVVSGFKQGSAPAALVIGAVGRNVLVADAIATLLEHYCKASIGNKINAMGEPRVLDKQDEIMARFVPGQSLSLKLSVDVWPEVTLSSADYFGLEVEIEVPPFNQAAYDSTLQQLQQRQAKLKDYALDYKASEGDTLLVDMTGYEQLEDGSKGEELKQASGAQLTVELLPGRFMPGLVEGLLGAKAGENRLVPVQFSTRSQAQGLSGKKLLFDVNVMSVQSKVIPELDDDFANSIAPGLTMEGLNDKVREGVQAEVDKAVKTASLTQLELALVLKLMPNTPVPDTLVTEHARKQWAAMLTDVKDKEKLSDEDMLAQVTSASFEAFKAENLDGIKMIVRGSLLIEQIAKLEGVAVDKADMEEQKMMMKASNPKGMEKVDDAMLMTQIEATLLRDKVLELVATKSVITKVPMKAIAA